MDIVSKIKIAIKKNRENVLLDLYLKNYDASNFYFALVFNKKINKFKVLYVPIDAISSGENVSGYFCYQFIFMDEVNYLVNRLLKSETNISEVVDNRSKLLDSYYVEINTFVSDKKHKYMFSQYIDKEYIFLFDIISILFGYLPNIVSELCGKLLVDFNEKNDNYKYTYSLNLNLYDSDLSLLFNKIEYKYDYDDILFLEEFDNKYYGYINNNIIIVEYIRGRSILNICCDDLEFYSDEIYIILMAIKNKKWKNFYHLEIIKGNDYLNIGEYLCYGVSNNSFKIISRKTNKISFSLIDDEVIRINYDNELKIKIKKYLEKRYDKDRVIELLRFLKKE
ncbi:MAG: hypothetical protein IJI22_04380 [Bacilli bacterium]|nr:hypothetical protein [Bacilli bacterium]